MGSISFGKHLGGQPSILGRQSRADEHFLFELGHAKDSIFFRIRSFSNGVYIFGVEEHYRVTLLGRFHGRGIFWAADMASVCIWIR